MSSNFFKALYAAFSLAMLPAANAAHAQTAVPSDPLAITSPGKEAKNVDVLPPTELPVSSHGLSGKIFIPPQATGRYPALLVLGGSEGGISGSAPIAAALAQHGYVTFALTYFGEPGLPKELTNIPLEYFKTALEHLQSLPNVDRNRIGLVGSSKGAEAALLVASRNPDIKAVVVGAPSSVAWPGINREDYSDPSGSWTEGGEPIPFLPYDSSVPFTTIYNLYDGGLKYTPSHPDAIIPVERIHGSLMLICGQADSLSPSCKMTDAIVERLRGRHFKHRISMLRYTNVGHITFNVPLTPDQATDPAIVARLVSFGGNSTDDVKVLTDSWGKAIAFLEKELKR